MKLEGGFQVATMFIDCSPLSLQNLYFVVISCRGHSKKIPRTAHFLAALRSGVCCQQKRPPAKGGGGWWHRGIYPHPATFM